MVPAVFPDSLWAIDNWSTVADYLGQHIWLALIPTVVGLVLSVPLGLWLYDMPRVRSVVVVVASAIYTVPSLALFLIIPALIGTQLLSPVNVVIALSLYSTCLLLRSVLQALDAVPANVLDAGVAVGYSAFQRKLQIDLPLAIPVLTAGTRVVAVINVSLVSVGAVIGIGGLGRLFTAGYQRNFPEQIVTGIVLTVILAVIVDRVIALIGWRMAPWARATTSEARSQRSMAEIVELEV